MNDLISVIVPVYNVEEYLDACISSITAQTHPDLEILLVDDGSPDNCGVICDIWAERDSRIRVLHQENGGLSAARNAGLDIASGAYIAFVDSDDEIEPDLYERLLSALQTENADIAACCILACSPDRQEVWGRREYMVGDSETILSMLFSDADYPVAAWNKLYRRRCWEGLRFPVGRLCEDAFTVCLLADRAERIVQLPDALYRYHIRPGSIMTAPFHPQRLDEEAAWRHNYEFMEARYPRLQKAAFDFYLEKVRVLLRAAAEKRQQYPAEFTRLREILKKNLSYLAFSSPMSLKKRIKLLLDYLSL